MTQAVRERLSQIVFEENKKLATREISKLFKVHITEAQKILEEFVEENKDKDLQIKYVLTGYKDKASDDIRLQRFITVDKESLEEEKASFNELLSCVIKSVEMRNESSSQAFHLETNEDNEELLLKLQNLTFIRNEKISFRSKFLERKSNSNSNTTSSSQSTCASNSQTSQSPATSQSNSLANKKVEVIKATKTTTRTTLGFPKVDKKKFEEEQARKKQEELKLKEEKSKSMEVDAFDDSDDDLFKKMSNEQLEKGSKSLKRNCNSIKSESEDDLETKKENKKLVSSGKNRKRVKVLEDSEDEESNSAMEVDSKKSNNVLTSSLKSKLNEEKKEITKVISEEQTYLDADGYLVTKQVKTSVKSIETFENAKVPIKSEQPSQSIESNSDSTDETKKNVKKPVKALPANKKGQTSILSFFKPKN